MAIVALRKESVDRNRCYCCTGGGKFWSLSARRAWIEITFPGFGMEIDGVALRKESVDRNNVVLPGFAKQSSVALRKESVDRNTLFLLFRLVAGCRSPQGERG